MATKNKEKVSEADEEKGKKLLLRHEEPKKGKSNKETDGEGVTAHVKQDDFVIEKEEEEWKKHRLEKEQLATFNLEKFGMRMKHYINCGFNLLIYGVGSKWTFINNYLQRHMKDDHCLVVNGYHSATNMKTVTNPMMGYAQKYHLKYAANKKQSMSLND